MSEPVPARYSDYDALKDARAEQHLDEGNEEPLPPWEVELRLAGSRQPADASALGGTRA